MPTTESITDFAKRTGLSEKLVRKYVKQGILPHIKTGKSHVKIHIESSLKALDILAQENANQRAAAKPVPLTVVNTKVRMAHRHKKGRLPDSIRLSNVKG